MAVYYKPRFNNIYYSFLQRALNDGGNIVTPNASEIQGSIATMADEAALLGLIPTAYNTGVLYSMLPQDGTGDFTVSRNGNATYFNQQGELVTAPADVPRLSFDPSTGEFQGVLIEDEVTNLCTNSDPSTLPGNRWNVSFAPNDWGIGLNNKIIFVNGNFIGQPVGGGQPIGTFNTNFLHRVSFFAKRQDNNKPVIFPTSTGFVFEGTLQFDANIDVYFTDRFSTSKRYTNRIEKQLKNNVWYFEFTVEFTSPSSGRPIGFNKSNSNSANTVEISGITVVLVEQSPTSYIPTAGSQVTRPADIISVTGSTSLFGQTQGTILFGFQTSVVTSLAIDGLNFYAPSGYSKVAFTYSSSEKKLYQDGLLVDSATGSFSYGTLDSLFLGSNLSGSGQLQDLYIKEYSTYDYVFPEEKCIQLTSL